MFKRFGAGVAVGYVLGARAGQKRYDQISDLAEKALEVPFVERLADSGRTMAMDQGRRVLAGLKDRAQWNAPDEESDGDGGNDGGDGADDYDTDEYDEEPAEDDDRDEVVGEESDDDRFYDDDDDEPQAVDDEAVDDEADDEVGDDEADDEDDGDDGDDGDSRASNGHARSQRGRSKHRIGSLASAARERGRVD